MTNGATPRLVEFLNALQYYQTTRDETDHAMLQLLTRFAFCNAPRERVVSLISAMTDPDAIVSFGLLVNQEQAQSPLERKLESLQHCVLNDHWEDALGHLFDLLHYLCPSLTTRVIESGNGISVTQPPQRHPYGNAAYFSSLWTTYGSNPENLRGENGEEETEGQD